MQQVKIKNFECTQCGAVDFTEEGDSKLRCVYCRSLFLKQEERSANSRIRIKKGAKVVFRSSANVIIRGELNIEDGAEVEFNGTILLLKKGSKKNIQQAKLRLQKGLK